MSYKSHILGQLLVGLTALVVPLGAFFFFFDYYSPTSYEILGTVVVAATAFKLSVLIYMKMVPAKCSECGGKSFRISDLPITFKCKRCRHTHITTQYLFSAEYDQSRMKNIMDTQYSKRERKLFRAFFIQVGLLFLLGAIFAPVEISLGIIDTITFGPLLDYFNDYRPYSDIAVVGLFTTTFCTMLACFFAQISLRCPKCKRRIFKRVPYAGNVAFICKRCGIRIKTESKYPED